MSKDVQSATVRGVVACGDDAEKFEKLHVQAAQCLHSASAVLRMYWRDPECEVDSWRDGCLVDGSDTPAPMDPNAVEGVGQLVDLAYSKLLDFLELRCSTSFSICPVHEVLVPVIHFLARSRGCNSASLTPAMAFAIGGLLDQAVERLDEIKLPSVLLQEAA
jgi:hypothetical protein